MKKTIVLLATLIATSAFGAPTSLNLVEKASHRLMTLVKNGKAPASTSTDLKGVNIEQGNFGGSPNGFRVTLHSQSAAQGKFNTVELFFDASGKAAGERVDVSNGTLDAPIFTQADGAKLLDLASEEVVDHLAEDTALKDVANQTHLILVTKSVQAPDVFFHMHMDDGRIYEVVLDLDGNLIHKSFKQ
jgi:hypothetical protein